MAEYESAFLSLRENARQGSITKLQGDIEHCLVVGIPVNMVQDAINDGRFNIPPSEQHD